MGKIVLGGRQSYRQFFQVSAVLVINKGVQIPSLPVTSPEVFMVFGWYVFWGPNDTSLRLVLERLGNLKVVPVWFYCAPFTQNNCLWKKGQHFLSKPTNPLEV